MRNANAIVLVGGLLLLAGCYGNKTLRQPITIEEIATDVQEIRGNQVTLSAEMRKLEEQIAAQAASLEKLRAENKTLSEQLGDQLTAIDNKLKEAIGRSSGYSSTARPYWSGDAGDQDSSGNSRDGGSRDAGGNSTDGSTGRNFADSGTDSPAAHGTDSESADGEERDGATVGSAGTRNEDGAPPPTDVTGLPPEAQAKTIYEQAYLDLTRGNYSLAILGFIEFLRRTPESDLADNAQYWIGESYYAQKDYRQAILEFEKVVDRYGSGDKVPSALLKVGFSQINIGDNEAARATLTDVTRRFPDSEESRLARDKLRTLD